MTHPFHPLYGREFELIESTVTLGVEHAHYTSDDGTLRTILKGWTSAGAEDPFVRVAAGRSAFRVLDLLVLAALLDALGGNDCAGRAADGAASGVKEILSHV